MPRSPEDNQQLKDARRIEILRAASRVFAKKGLAAAKISDIAHEAGLSHGLVYHYFENKDAVFAAILDEKLARMRNALAEDEALPGTNADRMRASIERWLSRTQEEPEMGLMIAQATLSGSMCSDARKSLEHHADWSFSTSIERIREAQSRGEIGDHAPAEELASCLFCIMRGLSLLSLSSHCAGIRAPSVDTVMRILLPGSALAARDAEPQASEPPPPEAISIPRVTARAARVGALPKSSKKKTPASKPAKTTKTKTTTKSARKVTR